MNKYIYFYDEGDKNMTDLLGNKGANLAEMARIGLPIPVFFTITTEAWRYWKYNRKVLKEDILREIFDNVRKVEKLTGKSFGDPNNPLLLAVRSGASVSMPGKLETITNVGNNDKIAQGLADITGDPFFAYDTYRKFVRKFTSCTAGVDISLLPEEKNRNESLNDIKENIKSLKTLYSEKSGAAFPEDPENQIIKSIEAVFDSWHKSKAFNYRQMKNIGEFSGTAATVQEMAFGNISDDSGTAVVFTRDRFTGEKKWYGEYLVNAQGEDIVSSCYRIPSPIAQIRKDFPNAYKEIVYAIEKLERHYKDMQDIEITIERSKVKILQTRAGMRSEYAELSIAAGLVMDGIITSEEAIERIKERCSDFSSIIISDSKGYSNEALKKKQPIANGVSIIRGVVSGKVCFDKEDVETVLKQNHNAILVCEDLPEYFTDGLTIPDGIITSKGGKTFHEAVVSFTRNHRIIAIMGCKEIDIVKRAGYFTALDKKEYAKGSIISLDGYTGRVYPGEIPVEDNKESVKYKWAADYCRGIIADISEESAIAVARIFQKCPKTLIKQFIAQRVPEYRYEALYNLFKDIERRRRTLKKA